MNEKIRNWFKKQPDTIYVADIEIPSYQKYWRDQRDIERKMSSLKIASIIQYICITLLSIAVIVLSGK